MSMSESSSSVRSAESVQDLQVKTAMVELKLPCKRWWRYLLSPWTAVMFLMIFFVVRDVRRDSREERRDSREERRDFGVKWEERRIRKTAQDIQDMQQMIHLVRNQLELINVERREEIELRNAAQREKEKELDLRLRRP